MSVSDSSSRSRSDSQDSRDSLLPLDGDATQVLPMPHQVSGAPTVLPVPGAPDTFTFEKAAAKQIMPGTNHHCEEGSKEWHYFQDVALELMRKLATESGVTRWANQDHVEALLRATLIIDAITVRLGQLKHVSIELIEEVKALFGPNLREDVFTSVKQGDSIFTHFKTGDIGGGEGDIGGGYYEVMPKRAWPWSTEISLYALHNDGREYCFHFCQGKRNKDQIVDPAHDKLRQAIIIVTLFLVDPETGEKVKLPFYNPSEMWLKDNKLYGRLLSPCNSTPGGESWPLPEQHMSDTAARRLADGVAYCDPNQEFTDQPIGNFEFDNCDGFFCQKKMTKEGSIVHTKLAAFEIVRVLKLVSFVELIDSCPSFHLILVRLILNREKSEVVYLKYSDKNRNKPTHNARELLVEVPVLTSYKTKADLASAMSRYNANLIVLKLTPDMLAEWISQQPPFKTKKAIVRLGVQENGEYVSHNLVFGSSSTPFLIKETEWEVVNDKVSTPPTYST